MTTDYVPLIEKTEIVRSEDSDVPRVWYRVTAPGDAYAADIQAGSWVLVLARVNSIRRSGGYTTGGKPPWTKAEREVEKLPREHGLEFRLDQNEIYYLPGLVAPKGETT